MSDAIRTVAGHERVSSQLLERALTDGVAEVAGELAASITGVEPGWLRELREERRRLAAEAWAALPRRTRIKRRAAARLTAARSRIALWVAPWLTTGEEDW